MFDPGWVEWTDLTTLAAAQVFFFFFTALDTGPRRSLSLELSDPKVYEPWWAGSYLRRIDSFITQLKAQGPSRTCNES